MLQPGDASEVRRFHKFVVCGPREDDCALWIGAIADDGYGRFWIRRAGRQRVVRPHRYALALAHGALGDDELGLHQCDNPICVRVVQHALGIGGRRLHVVAGTQAQNLAEMAAKGRGGGRSQFGSWSRPDVAARAARSRALRAAVRGGWNADAVEAALASTSDPTLF